MAKMLNMKDFDFTAIGTSFELDEVMPKFATEERKNDQGKAILERNYRKKATQITVK